MVASLSRFILFIREYMEITVLQSYSINSDYKIYEINTHRIKTAYSSWSHWTSYFEIMMYSVWLNVKQLHVTK